MWFKIYIILILKMLDGYEVNKKVELFVLGLYFV